jgi:hypothetical protein
MRRRPRRLAARPRGVPRHGALILFVAVAACGPHTQRASCTSVEAICPTTQPSYATDIAPIVQERCVTCHYAGTAIAPTDLSTYALVRRQGGTILSELQSCMMPPPDAGVLDGTDRTTFVEWLRCGAPNN